MKRLITASLLAGFFVAAAPSSGQAGVTCHQRFTTTQTDHQATYTYRGTVKVSQRSLRRLGYMEACLRRPRLRARVLAYDHHKAQQHAARVAALSWTSPDPGVIPGVPYAFADCVAMRESTDDTNPQAGGNWYGILPSSGYTIQPYNLTEQKHVFAELYAQHGDSAWRPFETPPCYASISDSSAF